MQPTEVINNHNDTVTLKYDKCFLCMQPSEVTMPRLAYKAWQQGAFMQNAWPEGSVGDREIAISGAHSECYDKAFKEDESMEATGDQTVEGYGPHGDVPYQDTYEGPPLTTKELDL